MPNFVSLTLSSKPSSQDLNLAQLRMARIDANRRMLQALPVSPRVG